MKSILRTSTYLLLYMLLFTDLLSAQQIRKIQSAYAGDSSYYDISQIAPGRFWAGGENGILNELDEEGNVTRINFPDPTVDILKIEAREQQIFVGTNHGGLFKYDRTTQSWDQARVPKNFKNRCFYDMMIVEERGELLVSGGHEKIAKGQKTIPHGFIASIDFDFIEELTVQKKQPLRFIWALERQGDKIYAASYSGFNTKILDATALNLDFKKQRVVSGLIHHLESIDGSIYYSGTASNKFGQHGIVGKLGGTQKRIEGYGCIWSIKEVHGMILATDYNGDVLILNEDLHIQKRINATKHSLYELAAAEQNMAYAIGHGRMVVSVDLNAVDFSSR